MTDWPWEARAEGNRMEDVKALGITDAVWHERDGKLHAFVRLDLHRGAVAALQQIAANNLLDPRPQEIAERALDELGVEPGTHWGQ